MSDATARDLSAQAAPVRNRSSHRKRALEGQNGGEDKDEDLQSPRKMSRVGGSGMRRASKERILVASFEMPFEIILEIFSHLDVKDFRRMVINPSTLTIWKEAREATGALSPPPGVSEVKWTSFLFTSFCHSCGAANSYTEFFLMRHLCQKCRKDKQVVFYMERPVLLLTMPLRYATGNGKWKPRSLDTDFDSERLLYVPHTLYSASHPKQNGPYRYMYEPDAINTEASWRALKNAVELGEPGSAEAFEEFKREKRDFVKYLRSNAPRLCEWAASFELEMRRKNLWAFQDKCLGLIKERFYALGTYQKCDIDSAVRYGRSLLRIGTTVKLTETAWQKIFVKLEPVIHDKRRQRHESVKAERVDTATKLLKEWKESLDISTSERLMYPDIRDLYLFPEMVALLALDCDLEDLEEHYQPLINAFPRLSAEFIVNRRSELRGAVPASNLADYSPDPLELATSTFRPPLKTYSERGRYAFENGDVVVGWKAHSVCHFCHMSRGRDGPAPCEFDPSLSALCFQLVTACGLDPYAATVDDMDEADERFLCRDCLDTPGDPRDKDMFVYTWRAALSHAHMKHKDAEGTVRVVPLDRVIKRKEERDRFRKIVDAQEEVNRSDRVGHANVWWCNHCNVGDHKRPGRRGEILQHLKESHDIEEPTIPMDYFLDEHNRKWYERPCNFSMEDGELQILPGVPPSEEDDVRYRR